MLDYRGCQKPFSVSSYGNDIIAFTIQSRGDCSNKMINARLNDYFGLTGPLGNCFKTDSFDNFLLIGGGIGTAPIFFLANYLKSINKKFDLLFGARNISNLEYSFSLKNYTDSEIIFFTDDGSYGEKGFVTDGINKLLEKKKYVTCCICGPEKMMTDTLQKLKSNIADIQISMERYMKCGLGLCGSCVLDDIGLRVCEEGPVFSYYNELSRSKEFGNYHRNSSGIIER